MSAWSLKFVYSTCLHEDVKYIAVSDAVVFNNIVICMLVAVSHLEDLVLIDSTSVCGVKASASCSVLEALASGQLLT